jgi:2-iminobutanoate/2-iminopropanoate deaminase
MKSEVSTQDAPKAAGPYSQAIVMGDMVFTSGQIYLTKDGKLLEGSVEEQAHQIMKNLQAVLKSAGVGFGDVVKATVYITDTSILGKVNEVYGSYMAKPFPAREMVCVKELPLGAKIEISMIAVRSTR